MRLINLGDYYYIDADKVDAIDIDLLTGRTQIYVGGKWRFCTMMPIDEVVEKVRNAEENEQDHRDRECETCRYCEVPAYEEPCKSCMRNHKDNWRAKK